VVITGGEEGGSFSGGMNRQLRRGSLTPLALSSSEGLVPVLQHQ
jgi:hypothetical protein